MARLSPERTAEIEAIIEDLTLKTGFMYPGDNLLDLAKRVGIEVYTTNLNAVESNLMTVLQYGDPELKTNPKMYLHSGLPEDQMRFMLAHEYGHYFLHKGSKLRFDRLDATADVQEEAEANYFATSLLVPEEFLLKQLERGRDVAEMAASFGVSVPVIENRLRWLDAN